MLDSERDKGSPIRVGSVTATIHCGEFERMARAVDTQPYGNSHTTHARSLAFIRLVAFLDPSVRLTLAP
jgi:hypothetical protein